ncbi:hypothetical protein CC86DRAFT_130195 [Ophiobolus disseminans]|uniref:Uncharacterized protein n=1 Tax=Ophiobolus disseminans TaxID=1469910 RepID=A0A6A6ZFL7_9PLEO|nr:hypothetical protein CC86DRAFT_130195 [Ophiobolus disseminans]
MVLLSSASLLCKYRRRSSKIRTLEWLWSDAMQADGELLPAHRSSSTPDWVGMDVVRQSQQRTYTSMIRTRRGPQPWRSEW